MTPKLTTFLAAVAILGGIAVTNVASSRALPITGSAPGGSLCTDSGRVSACTANLLWSSASISGLPM